MKGIYEGSSILNNMIEEEKVGMVGAIYEVNTGKVQFDDFSPFLKQLDGKNLNLLADRLKNVLTTANRE